MAGRKPESPDRRVIVTCGPGHAEIDTVRRITNFSTGSLGLALCRALASRDFEVLCLRGEGATARETGPWEVREFGTNTSLLALLEEEAPRGARAVFHVAALADFEVNKAALPAGGKIRSDSRGLTLELIPAPKILPLLRGLFPAAWIVGWKYEVDGIPAGAMERARAQIRTCRSDHCVLNGPASGEGFRLVDSAGGSTHYADRDDLARGLAARLADSP